MFFKSRETSECLEGLYDSFLFLLDFSWSCSIFPPVSLAALLSLHLLLHLLCHHWSPAELALPDDALALGLQPLPGSVCVWSVGAGWGSRRQGREEERRHRKKGRNRENEDRGREEGKEGKMKEERR